MTLVFVLIIGIIKVPYATHCAGAKRRNTAPASELEGMVNCWEFGLPADQGMQQDVLQLAEAATAAGQAFDSSSQESSLSTHIMLPMAASQPSSLPNQSEHPTQFHLHLSASAASFATPYSHQQQPCEYLGDPQGSDISGWNSEEMNEPFAMDVQDCLASAQTTQQTSVHEEGADASSGEDQLAVIQPAIQHVVLSFLAKMHALVARRRMQRGETMSLSLQLDQRRRLHQCVATWTKCRLLLAPKAMHTKHFYGCGNH